MIRKWRFPMHGLRKAAAHGNLFVLGDERCRFRKMFLYLAWGVLFFFTEPLLTIAEPALPFALTAEEEKEIDQLLNRWEQWNSQVKTLECRFKRWHYDLVFGPSDRAKSIDFGGIRYAAGRSEIWSQEKEDETQPINADLAERWLFDGESLWEYRFREKKVMEYKLPTEWKASKLIDGPMAWPTTFAFLGLQQMLHGTIGKSYPFPLAAKAETLKQQYYLRICRQGMENKDKEGKATIGIEAYPRSKTFFQSMSFLFSADDMSPLAVKIIHGNEKEYSVYQFYDLRINDPASASDEKAFQPTISPGWELVQDAGRIEISSR
jgi:hypothetical protein